MSAAAAPRKPRARIGVIGLGIIGTRVAANLRGAGHQVYVWSRSPHRAPNFLGSVVEVADLSDVIQVFVSDDAALLDVTRTVAAALSPRHVFACHATVSPGTARQAASIIEGQGARYLDAPFTGSKAAAQNRQLVYYVGGGKEALEEIRPVLEATSKKILHVGGIGDASVIKIATNMLTASTVQTLAEALALVRAAGIGDQKFAEAMEYNGSRSGTSDLKLPAMIAQNFEPNFSLKHMLKDARLAMDLADKMELSLPVTEITAEVLSLGMANGWADEDFCCVTQLYPAPEKPEPTATGDQEAAAPPVPDDAPVAGPSDDIAPLAPPTTARVEPIAASKRDAASRLKTGTIRILRGLFKGPVPGRKPAALPGEARPAPVHADAAPPPAASDIGAGTAPAAQSSATPARSDSALTPEH